ncbi:unnamed protein product [Diatraea saccharalis]|uniref:Uncharacterized protein n=1 Tax=Diatraea saccharalis TaxID=40085 RepID=A0A9N9R016_9NEOP|nr:unnamed protein product [Diatraea saccharalis]
MAPKSENSEKAKKRVGSVLKINSNTAPAQPIMPSTSKEPGQDVETGRRKCFDFIYNKKEKSCFGRTAKSWLYILSYAVMYIMFLCTYTLIFLFATLTAFKHSEYSLVDRTALFTYSERGVGLSATPTSEFSYPMIWYRSGDDIDYQKYIRAIDRLLVSRRDMNIDYTYLGPCSRSPYGYGSEPCVIIRINRQFKWSGKPLQRNSTKAADAPKEVREWMASSEKLWLHCSGYHSYDKEHIGRITYYPYPPGFDPSLFPLDVRNPSPLVAIQMSGFTKGISLAVKCNLWYEDGPSAVEFMLYVEPQLASNDIVRSRNISNIINPN